MTTLHVRFGLYGIVLSLGALVSAQPRPGTPPEESPVVMGSIGVLVGSAERMVGVSLDPTEPNSPAQATVVGGSLAEVDLREEHDAWAVTVSTSQGDFQIVASLHDDPGTDETFIYEVTNLSYGTEGAGIVSLAVPLGTQASPHKMSVVGNETWNTRASIGLLGGFLVYDTNDATGIGVGETATFSFSLTEAFIPPGGEPNSPPPLPPGEEPNLPPFGRKEKPFPPGLFLSGQPADFAVIDLPARKSTTGNENLDTILRAHLLGVSPEDRPCTEGMPNYFETPLGGFCLRGVMAISPIEAGVLLELKASGPAVNTGPLGGDVLVAMPIRPGEQPQPDPPLPPRWYFEAPDRPDTTPGFALFSGPLKDLSLDQSALLEMTWESSVTGEAKYVGIFGKITECDCDWRTDTCTVEGYTFPGNTPCEIQADHGWYPAEGTIAEHDYRFLHATSDPNGQFAWTFSVPLDYSGPGGRPQLEYVAFRVILFPDTGHGIGSMDWCYWVVCTKNGTTYEGEEACW